MPIPTDPLLASQWHLNNTTAGLLDLNVFGVWNPAQGPAYTGAGTRTLVVDDGFDYTHPDFDNYNQGLDLDFDALNNGSNGDNDFDPFGLPGNSHGTAVAGIIGAAADGAGAVGVAHGTELVGYRTAGFISDGWLQDIRDSIHHAAISSLADVTNISRSISGDPLSEFGVGYNAVRFDEIETSIGTAVNSGRGGLGMTIVKAAGNARSDIFDINVDDFTNDTRQVVVAAVNQNGSISSYSSYGAAILVSAFGTPGEIVTTDRVGGAGYTGADFYSGFSGTAAAAAMVSGIVSLMYDANSGLGWRDVQSILASSARQVGSEVGAGRVGSERYTWNFNAAGTWNGGGQHFSSDYGYGLVDGLAAVRLAETWLFGGASAATSGNESANVMDVLNAVTVIPDGIGTGQSFTGTAAFDYIVERVTVQMTFNTNWVSDMEIFLTSPDGLETRLLDRTGFGNSYDGTWTFESQAFRGERAAGNWTVRVVDGVTDDILTVSDIVIRTYGAATFDDRYIYTNELSDYYGAFGHVTSVIDTNGGGNDTVNAAAVTSSSTIYLDGAATTSTIDGVFVSFQNIENAIGGDGHDTIGGNAGANELRGLRGSDTLKGAGGNDTLYGNWGDDSLLGDDGDDALFGGDGVDAISGGAGNDRLDGGDGEDNSHGEAGNDTFTVTGSDVGDNVYGGADNDTLDLGGSSFSAYNVNLQLQTYERVPNAIGAAGVHELQGVENVRGTNFNDVITGDGAANILVGGVGADTMAGGGGDDSIYVDNVGDTVSELAAGGALDTIFASISYTSVLNVERMYLTGSANINGTGVNGQNDIMYGNTGANTLNGLGGTDNMNGGNGSDTYYVNTSGDVINEAAGAAAGTNDTVFSQSSYTINANVERLFLLNGGNYNANGRNGQNDFIAGKTGNNIINGLSGNDTIRGGLGNDTLSGGRGWTFSSSSPRRTAPRTGTRSPISAPPMTRSSWRTPSIRCSAATGVLAANLFKNLNLGAQDADDRILYNDQVSGDLLRHQRPGSRRRHPVRHADRRAGLTNGGFRRGVEAGLRENRRVALQPPC